MRKFTKSITVAAIVGIVLSFITVPVLAAIAQPDSLQINDVRVYENGREAGDQTWLITYYIGYTTEPDETAEELFILRLLDTDDSEIAATRPYAFYNDGYDIGVMAFYFDADDAPDYESALKVQLTGDPLQDWTGGVPITTTDGIVWQTGSTADIQELLSSRIIYLAGDLEQAWTVEMVTTTQGTTILSDTGAAYFLRVVPYLRIVAPYALGEYTFTPDFPETDPTDSDYADDLLTAIDGTILDITPVERSLQLERGTLTAFFYYAFVIGLLVLLIAKYKFKKGTVLIGWPFMLLGAFIGVPLIVTIVAAFICLISTGYVVWKNA